MKISVVHVLLAASVLVGVPTYAADVAAGKAKSDACVDCHGDDGTGDDESPDIAGMPVEKFTKAMKEFQNGTRTKSAKMVKEAKKLSDADVANLAAYYLSLKK